MAQLPFSIAYIDTKEMMMSLMNSLINSKTMHRDLLLPLVMALLLTTSTCSGNSNAKCVPSSCGGIQNIRSPFRLKGDPEGCGNSWYELACENNRTILHLYKSRYYVRSITYGISGVLRLAYDGLQKEESSSLPRYTATFSKSSPRYDEHLYDPSPPSTTYYYHPSTLSTVSILNCSKPAAYRSYVTATETCMQVAHNASIDLSRTNNYYLYTVLNPRASDVKDFCTIRTTVLVRYLKAEDEVNHPNLCDRIHNMLTDEFELNSSVYVVPMANDIARKVFHCYFGPQYIPRLFRWCRYHDNRNYSQYCDHDDKYLEYSKYTRTAVEDLRAAAANLAILLAHLVATKFILGAPFVLVFLIFKWKRRHLAMDANIEDFLLANNNFLPIRYSYSDIKKITKNFNHKLGEGGYGSVYRGKLRSGIEVAIKVLKKSKGNGEDFISEVATIGRIHHVNVVQLIGFCIEGSKLALVYPFMSNGSLDKHIFSKVNGTLLNCKKIYEIAFGVARGIEYLHQGCDMQILHFDIKPHNILLDENFIPKVSDFGLARLYPANCSIVSLTSVRGTMGYMAPELFYKSIGGVSYKADVYSFSMLLMEMASRRRNINENTEHSSQIYFPLWIYDQLNKGEKEPKELLEGEHEVAKKMIVVALWCIQLNPNHRPSMKRIVTMLEGDIAQLQIPPKPLLYPTDPAPIIGNVGTEIELEIFPSSTSAPKISASLRPFENTS